MLPLLSPYRITTLGKTQERQPLTRSLHSIFFFLLSRYLSTSLLSIYLYRQPSVNQRNEQLLLATRARSLRLKLQHNDFLRSFFPLDFSAFFAKKRKKTGDLHTYEKLSSLSYYNNTNFTRKRLSRPSTRKRKEIKRHKKEKRAFAMGRSERTRKIDS